MLTLKHIKSLSLPFALPFVLFAALFVSGCTGIPEGMTPVKNFDLTKYEGKWYEISRLNHSFEEGLEQVTAQYKIQEDGSVEVVNRGFSVKDNEWQQATGKAKFVETTDQGYLKVSFFGPFYGSYIVFELDENYQYAFVSGPDLSYLWLLSRTKTISPELMAHFKKQAASYGFNTDELIVVNQNANALTN